MQDGRIIITTTCRRRKCSTRNTVEMVKKPETAIRLTSPLWDFPGTGRRTICYSIQEISFRNVRGTVLSSHFTGQQYVHHIRRQGILLRLFRLKTENLQANL